MEEKENKIKRNLKYVWIGLGTLLICLFAAYIGVAVFFGSHFYPGTTVNGITAALATADTVEAEFIQDAEDFIISVHDREDRVYYITSSDIDYKYESSGEVSDYLARQNEFMWPIQIRNDHTYTVAVKETYDEDKLLAIIDTFDCFKEENIVAPQDAYLEKTDTGYQIMPEVQGSQPIKEQIIILAEEALADGTTTLTLSDDAYAKPAVTSDDPELAEKANEAEKYRQMSITYEIEGYDEVLSGDTIASWITIDDNMKVTVNEDMVTAYVQRMASKYNTYGDTREFQTTLGGTVSIGGGDYGWVISKSREAAQLIKDIESGQSVTREPCWEQEAFVKGVNDIGSTYVEIDYTNQHLWYYKDGALIADGDIVSGNLSNGNGSPDGVFKIISKKSPAVLSGEDYQSDVTYFMPFAYNVGVHDASWRSSFGGSIYKTAGSHGCINMSYDVVKNIFSTVETGTPVVAYYRESVTLTSTNAGVSNAYSYSGN